MRPASSSELITVAIPPAAWKAAQGGMNIFLITLCGATGSVIGAMFNYTLARFLGRKVIYALASTKVAKLMMIKPESVEKAENYFLRYGNVSTFIGRLVPGIRHLISIPAGLAKMNIRNFMFFTFVGAAIWSSVLAALGYFLYSQKEMLEEYYGLIGKAGIAAAVILGIYIVFTVTKNFKTKPRTSALGNPEGAED